MGEIAPRILTNIFLGLSLLHFSWALGSQWGFANSLPTDNEGNRVINPKKKDSLVVGLGLFLFAILYFFTYKEIQFMISESIQGIALWVVPSIFLLRTVGDFRYIGLFKKVKDTPFGKTDTRLIIPLCILITVLGYWVAAS